MSAGKVRQLVERANKVTAMFLRAGGDTEVMGHVETWKQICAEADALDSRPLWPSGDAAAEQLAKAWRETWLYDKSLALEKHAAAALARLNAADGARGSEGVGDA